MPKRLILDGGLGTSLEQNHGIKFGPSTPLWSSDLLVSDPETLLHCQKDFGDAPVDIILTATYQVSIEGFAATRSTAKFPNGISKDSIPRFLDDAVSIAARAKQEHAHVALSIGPYGACMIPSQEYSGKYDAPHDTAESLLSWHRERMQLFAAIQDLPLQTAYIALETIPRVDEIKAMRRALDAVPELATNLPFWMSCLFPGDGEALPDGSSPEMAVQAMLDPSFAQSRPWGIGINCTKVWKLDALLRRYEAAVATMVQEGHIQEWPALVLYPDGTNGEVYNTATQQWELPECANASKGDRIPWEHQLAQVVQQTEARGKWRQIVVGGCCMARPADITRLGEALREA